MPTRITIKDIAKELGISPSSVSRALTDKKDISDNLKKKVKQLAKQLNYQPNPLARSFRIKKSKTIAVVIPDVSNYFFSLALKGIEEICNKYEYHVLVYQTNESLTKEINLFYNLKDGRVDGVLVSPCAGNNSNALHIHTLYKQMPVVFFDRHFLNSHIPHVTCNDFQAGYLATKHLIKNGNKQIAFLGIDAKLSVTSLRLDGYLAALNEYNIKYTSELVILSKSEAIMYNKIEALLQNYEAPIAFFSTSERYAWLLYKACKILGYNIPDQVKIISFSSFPLSVYLHPSMSTVSQPAYEMGKMAAQKLLKNIPGNTFKSTIRESPLLCEFNFRNSTQA